jgi:hypothetical protein
MEKIIKNLDKPISYRLENELKIKSLQKKPTLKTSFNYSSNFFDSRFSSPTRIQTSKKIN